MILVLTPQYQVALVSGNTQVLHNSDSEKENQIKVGLLAFVLLGKKVLFHTELADLWTLLLTE